MSDDVIVIRMHADKPEAYFAVETDWIPIEVLAARLAEKRAGLDAIGCPATLDFSVSFRDLWAKWSEQCETDGADRGTPQELVDHYVECKGFLPFVMDGEPRIWGVSLDMRFSDLPGVVHTL